jgi:LacI family transcriptional regulator
MEGIQNGAAKITPLGVDVEILEYDRYDLQSFHNKADEILRSKPDGVILPPIMSEKTRPFIEALQGEQKPYVFFDADIPDMKPLCVVGHDSFKGGYLAGRLMHLFAGRITKPAVVLDAHGEDYHIIQRRKGFLRYAEEHGFPALFREYSGYAGAELSEQEITCFLLETSDLAGIFVTNCLAHRVAEVAKRLFAERHFFIIGYDLIPNNRRLLEQGWIDAIIAQRPEEQGRLALQSLYQHIVLEQKVASRIEIPMDIYIRENIPKT